MFTFLNAIFVIYFRKIVFLSFQILQVVHFRLDKRVSERKKIKKNKLDFL